MSQDPIALGERIVALLGTGSFNTTYKHAVLLGLMDLCFERVQGSGEPPQGVTTRQLAEKVVGLYWDQVRPYGSPKVPDTLVQGKSGQAEIVGAVAHFRSEVEHGRSSSLARARAADPDRYLALVHRVEWKLIQMPLPRLQILGRQPLPFLYTIGWDKHVRRAEVRTYQETGTGSFDNRIVFKPDIAAQLVRLSGLLRPIVQRHWAEQVRTINALDRHRLEAFLFAGRERVALTPLREGLRELQKDHCFYCNQRIGDEAEVDHFIPWARFPDDSIQNLVLADRRCNNGKRDFLAGSRHLARWVERLASPDHDDLRQLARAERWESDASRMPRVARALYLNLSPEAWLWQDRSHFEPADHTSLVRVFAAAPALDEVHP